MAPRPPKGGSPGQRSRSAGSPGQPLLPLSRAPPGSPGAAGGGLPLRAVLRRTVLAALVLFVALNAWRGSSAIYAAWQGRGGNAWQQRGQGSKAADGSASARAAASGLEAGKDAGAALQSAAGAVKHAALAGAHAAGAAGALLKPAASKAANATAAAAFSVGAVASNLTWGAPARVPDERATPSTRPPAELLPPRVAATSADACAQALGIPKVALLFLTKGPLPHEPSWRLWFESAAGLVPAHEAEAAVCGSSAPEHRALLAACAAATQQEGPGAADAEAVTGVLGGEALENDSPRQQEAGAGADLTAPAARVIERQRLFSVYVHAPPEFEGYPADSLWAGHLIPRRTATGWGDISLVEAARNLLWTAFRDPLNQRFVLLSESDAPLYDPLTLHRQLSLDPKSRCNACMHGARHEWRWSADMETEHLRAAHWRKSGQFFGLTRAHAEAVLRDVEVYRSFEVHCWSDWSPRRNAWRDCFPDEHYMPTLLAALGRDNETHCDSWGVAAQDWSRGGAHPKSFAPEEVGPALVARMRDDPARCNATAAYEDAQRAYVDVGAALLPGQDRACKRLLAAAAAALEPHLMPGACPLTVRKLPANTADAVHLLFNSSCPAAPGAAPGEAPPLNLNLTGAEAAATAAAAAEQAGGSSSGNSSAVQPAWDGGAEDEEEEEDGEGRPPPAPPAAVQLLTRRYCERAALGRT